MNNGVLTGATGEGTALEKIRVTVWNEYRDEKRLPHIGAIYPRGIHQTISDFLRADGRFEVTTVTLDMPDQGLSRELLNRTDVLLWWGHIAHHEVLPETVNRVVDRVMDGMGFIPLHSGIFSEPFQRLVGRRSSGGYREVGELERMWVVNPAHPIVEGLGRYIEVDHSEMYCEPSGLAAPDELLFVSWFAGGEVFRSGGCYYRGQGRIFYFTCGHEEYPIYYIPEIQQVLKNACVWACNRWRIPTVGGEMSPLEKLDPERLLEFKK